MTFERWNLQDWYGGGKERESIDRGMQKVQVDR